MKRIALMVAFVLSLTVGSSVCVAGEILPGTPIRLSEHFLANEFRCKHCGELRIDAQLIIKLEELRALVGAPIVITSGYRCPVHNRRVGGVAHSQHMQGKAADLYVNGMNNRELARYAKQVGFSFIKVYSGWIHCDVR